MGFTKQTCNLLTNDEERVRGVQKSVVCMKNVLNYVKPIVFIFEGKTEGRVYSKEEKDKSTKKSAQ